MPFWFGEMTVTAHFLKRQEVLAAIEQHVRFARCGFGHYDLISLRIPWVLVAKEEQPVLIIDAMKHLSP